MKSEELKRVVLEKGVSIEAIVGSIAKMEMSISFLTTENSLMTITKDTLLFCHKELPLSVGLRRGS